MRTIAPRISVAGKKIKMIKKQQSRAQSLTTTRLADSTLINSYRMFVRARRDGDAAYVRLARDACRRRSHYRTFVKNFYEKNLDNFHSRLSHAR